MIFTYNSICLKFSFGKKGLKSISLSQKKHARPISWQELFEYKLDFSGFSDFQKKVFAKTREIPPGMVSTYKEVAGAIKKPKAYRAVGSVLSKNPFLIAVPCHRVVKSDLRIGNFYHGPEMKRKILESEGVRFSGNKINPEFFSTLS
jgi:O-6-methylguanine DNA methyltransferase